MPFAIRGLAMKQSLFADIFRKAQLKLQCPCESPQGLYRRFTERRYINV